MQKHRQIRPNLEFVKHLRLKDLIEAEQPSFTVLRFLPDQFFA